MCGLHFKRPPNEETKIVRCVRGAIFDVIVDLRPHSSSYLHDLTAENRRAVFYLERFAHGFQILAEHCEIAYQISTFYAPEAAGGYRYDDASFRITLTAPHDLMISERDLG
jgi:dTDP-4-dehydrorhamnose 3,5-epimerase